MGQLSEFRFLFRDAETWGLDNSGDELDDEDKAAALDTNQRALEDYLSNQLPLVFVQQAGLGSGTIDPAQLATGTAGTGKAPVSQGAASPAWTDIATQAELDAQSSAVVAYLDVFHERGRIAVSDLNGTNTVFAATFPTAFPTVPRVVATVECGQGIGVFPTLHAVNTTSFAGRIFTSATSTATCFVHWHAVRQ